MINYIKKISIDPSKKIYMFGAARQANMLTQALGLVGVRIDGYFDNAYPHGGENNYFHIEPVSRLKELDGSSSYFIIASSRTKEISVQLNQLGITKIFYPNQLAMNYNGEFTKIEFEYCNEPEVSILLTAHNGWDMTYNVLKSLSENDNTCKFEVILGDDCSDDLTQCAEEYFGNVRVIHHKNQLQYLGNVNAIAEEARGKYLFLLANDILFTQKRYIDILLDEIKKDSKIGMITGKLWIPYGSRYETHSIYERYDNPVKVELNHPRNVEVMWPVATIIPRHVWRQVNGFDPDFLPVYYEDWDIEMRIICAGYDLVAYPYAEVTHYEGGTYGGGANDILFQKNKELFESRWKDYIENEKERRIAYINARNTQFML